MEMINRAEYPELDCILWDLHCDLIEPRNAFIIYETRWKHVNFKLMTDKEKELVHELSVEFGNGVLLVSQQES